MSTPDSVDWFDRPHQILNLCYNALDRHVIRGRGDDAALVFHPISGEPQTYTYAELLERVAQLAGGLRELGVGIGDRVLLFLPRVAEAAMAVLACARIGAVHGVTAVDTEPEELAARIDETRPVVIVSASCALTGDEGRHVVALKPLLDEALVRSVHVPNWCVIFQRPQATADLQADRDLAFTVIMRPGAFEPAVPAELPVTTALYLLDGSEVTVADVLQVEDVEPDVTVPIGDLTTSRGPALLYGALLAGATASLAEDGSRLRD